jgi:hypothetical protein
MSHPIWITPAGSLGIYPASIPMQRQLQAIPDPPAVSVSYKIISGNLPTGLNLTSNGLIYGTPTTVLQDSVSTFVVRAFDELEEIRDRTFDITVSGVNSPTFTTPSGNILTLDDSTWTEFLIGYSNPLSDNPVNIRVLQGELPPGLEINRAGLIRGYAEPPITTLNLGLVITNATSTNTSNVITATSTSGFAINRPVVFSDTFGGIVAGTTYYIKSIISSTEFTITTTQDGETLALTNASGFMTVTLPNVSVGQPTIRQYSFTLQLESPLGNDLRSYFITVRNQNLSESLGGPGKGPNTRNPTILNTRPLTYDIENDVQNYGYYLLPPIDTVSVPGLTYNPNINAPIKNIISNNYFSFHILGKDFDGNELTYYYSDLPAWLTGDSQTGWLYGEPIIEPNSLSTFSFSVFVAKTGIDLSDPFSSSPTFNFSVTVGNNIEGTIVWITPSDLGTIFNSTVSLKSVEAVSDVDLSYRLTQDSGPLPNNLILSDNGQITGLVSYQPSNTFLEKDSTQTFTFTVEAYSPMLSVVSSSKTFTLTVIQQYDIPTDNLYIKCTPSIENRNLIRSLLDDPEIIPNEVLFRSDDIYFGKAKNVVYQHAYGIFSSDLQEYVEAVRKQHYWRNITLGEIKTAVARDENNNIVYEVVYSEIIDDLVNPKKQSVSYEVVWPRTINLNKGPWYTSVTNIYTSYEYLVSGTILTNGDFFLQTQLGVPIILEQGIPTFYTSLDPGEIRNLFPNSLPNMRERIQREIGYNPNFRLLPLWMTSQQLDGNTLGFTPAWVICYTKPGFASTIKNNIETKWVDFLGRPNKLNQINFRLDRFTVDKSLTYNYDKNIVPPAWTGLPSATPAPDPIDSQDFYVLFPRKTILPDSNEY